MIFRENIGSNFEATGFAMEISLSTFCERQLVEPPHAAKVSQLQRRD
jgi:thymidylate synthase ThyX